MQKSTPKNKQDKLLWFGDGLKNLLKDSSLQKNGGVETYSLYDKNIWYNPKVKLLIYIE